MMGEVSWDPKRRRSWASCVYCDAVVHRTVEELVFFFACSGPDEAEGVGHGAGQPQAGPQD